MNEINTMLQQIRIATIVRNVSAVVVVISGGLLLFCLIKDCIQHKPFRIFEYYYDYYDSETGKYLYSEKCNEDK